MSKQLTNALKNHFIQVRKQGASRSRYKLCARFPFECFSTFGSECPCHKVLGEACKDSVRLATFVNEGNRRAISLLESRALKLCNVRFNIKEVGKQIEPKLNAIYKQTVEALQKKNIIPKYKVNVPWEYKTKEKL